MNTPDERRYGVATAAETAGKTGLQLLQGIIDGSLPGAEMAKTLNFWLVEAGDGFCAFEGDTGPSLLNPQGTIHGGWALTLIDSAAGCAALSLLPADVSYATVETKANFSRPMRQDTGRVRAEARIISRGRQIMSAEAWVRDREGRLLAHGTSTLMVLTPRK